MSPKPVYLSVNAPPIGMAVTWWDVAELVSEQLGPITAEEIQHHGSEGPRGFYITLRRQVVNGWRS
jgi:hypothetical protein